MTKAGRLTVSVLAVAVLCGVPPVSGDILVAQEVMPARPLGAGETINLPYQLSQADALGNTWMVYNGGRLMQQGDMPMVSECMVLNVNGQMPGMNSNNATLDGSDVVLPSITAGGVQVTRRFSQGSDGSVRVIDIFKNTRGQDTTVSATYRTSFNYGVQGSRTLDDSKKTGKTLGGIVQDNQGRACLILQAGRGSQITPGINSMMRNNNYFNTTIPVKLAAGKEGAVLTVLYPCFGSDAADKYFQNLKESTLLASIPREIRKLIVNFPAGDLFGDIEILRGDTTDIVELRNGDQFRGNLKLDWKVNTDFGPAAPPADTVIGMVTRGTYRPRQLIATRDGQLIGGTLTGQTVAIELAGGQLVTIPLSQVSRIGVRKAASEPETIKPDKPMVTFRNGDHLAIQPLDQPISLATRFGAVQLPAAAVESIDLQPEDAPAHRVTLKDQNSFTGIVTATGFPLQFVASSGPAVQVPVSAIRRIDLAPPIENADAPVATMKLSGGDSLAGALDGQFKLDTGFTTLTLKAAEVSRLFRSPGSASDVQVTLWDQTSVKGQIQEPSLPLKLGSGTAVNVPVGIVEEYTCASPQPKSAVADKIKTLVAQLNADDWKQREQAEKELLGLGTPVVGSLKELRATQPPEAQQRIDSILKQLDKRR